MSIYSCNECKDVAYQALLRRLEPNMTDGSPTPKELMPAIVQLRDAALKAEHFDFAVILSHTHAWLYYLDKHWSEINGRNG